MRTCPVPLAPHRGLILPCSAVNWLGGECPHDARDVLMHLPRRHE